jgi:Ca2+-transporting ATPase
MTPSTIETGSSTPVAWHAMTAADALARCEAARTGLTAPEAERRLAVHGANVIDRARKDGPLAILLRQVRNPLIYVLLAAAAIAIGLGKTTDGLVVLAVVVLNALVGFVQEYRASRAIEALRDMVPEHALTLRDGRPATVAVAGLVPGDIVLLASGDKVPADLRLLEVKNLQVEEAALTGESVPVQKATAAVSPDAPIGDRSTMAFGGTLVTYGTASGLVVNTGARTELGRISTMLAEATAIETPLTRALASIGKMIATAVIAVSLVILAIGAARAMAAGLPALDAVREMLMFAIALAVGAIPEGLPAVVTIALAIGVQRMASRRAIIRKLPAVETLGSTTVICSDKTGTLTRNEMTLIEVWTPEHGRCRISGVGYDPRGEFARPGVPGGSASADVRALLEDAALCSDATLERSGERVAITGDPTEAALVVAAEKAGVTVPSLRRQRPRRDGIPFESEHQFMASLHDAPNGARLILKGAPEAVFRRCTGTTSGDALAAAQAEVERLAAGGMRVLAVAARGWKDRGRPLAFDDVASGFALLGIVGMIDPPRPEAVAAIAACRQAGIAVKMITGDHRATARAIGRDLGLDAERPLTGNDFAGLDATGQRQAARGTGVFARVAPEHKLRLVRALQEDGEVVAMTGDGVNDAPALKQADIGVAMGITGTSVSKEAADVVLTDDNFASIVAAVEEGRRVYDNLVKSLAFILPTNLGLALVIVYAVLFFPFDASTRELLLPIQPTQVLWINLVATVALALPLAFEAREPDVMRRPPRAPAAPVLSAFVVRRTVLVALLMAGGAIGLFQFEYGKYIGQGASEAKALAEAQTMAVTTVILFQTFYLLNCRSLRDSILAIGLFSNRIVFAGIAATVALQLAFIYAPPLQAVFGTAPLDGRDLLLSALVAAVVLPVIGLEKRLLGRRQPTRPVVPLAGRRF